jgi:hypothetical protein
VDVQKTDRDGASSFQEMLGVEAKMEMSAPRLTSHLAAQSDFFKIIIDLLDTRCWSFVCFISV